MKRFLIYLDTLPGAEWSYSNEAVQLLAPLIERASGLEAGSAFRELLFEPLGMDSTSLFRDPAGNAVVFGGARTTLRDFARIGLLMAAGGRWNDRQLLPAGWTRQAVTPIPQSSRYGFLWWIDPENGNYAAMGDFGQLCIVYPEQNLIYLRYQTCRNNDPSQNLRWMGPDFLNLIKRVVRE